MVGILDAMTKSVEELLNSFARLPEGAKREIASEIINRSLALHMPRLSEKSLLLS
jgi:hypothetical protein